MHIRRNFLCVGSIFTYKVVEHRYVLVNAVYQVVYTERNSYVRNLQDFDGNCFIPEGKQSTSCYDSINGINYFIHKKQKQRDCQKIHTRFFLLNGQIISDSRNPIFISQSEKTYLETIKNS